LRAFPLKNGEDGFTPAAAGDRGDFAGQLAGGPERICGWREAEFKLDPVFCGFDIKSPD
jgi:hypothetical protein